MPNNNAHYLEGGAISCFRLREPPSAGESYSMSMGKVIPFTPLHSSSSPLRQSVGVSPHSGALLQRVMEVLESLVENETGQSWAEWLHLAVEASSQQHNSSRSPEDLKSRLHFLFDAEPVEDGRTHAAEQVIYQLLRQHKKAAIWFSELANDVAYVHRIALLRCLGRMPADLAGSWGLSVMSQALGSEDVEVRDAAICAFELWGTREAAEILRAHHDPEPWLAQYAEAVLQDIA